MEAIRERGDMPEKRPGQVQKSIQFPIPLLAAVDKKRGGKPLNTYVCELAAKDTGEPYTAPTRGRPVKKVKPAPTAKPPARRGRKQP